MGPVKCQACPLRGVILAVASLLRLCPRTCIGGSGVATTISLAGQKLAGNHRGSPREVVKITDKDTEISQIRYPLISEHATACKRGYSLIRSPRSCSFLFCDPFFPIPFDKVSIVDRAGLNTREEGIWYF